MHEVTRELLITAFVAPPRAARHRHVPFAHKRSYYAGPPGPDTTQKHRRAHAGSCLVRPGRAKGTATITGVGCHYGKSLESDYWNAYLQMGSQSSVDFSDAKVSSVDPKERTHNGSFFVYASDS